MKKAKYMTVLLTAAIFVLACFVFAACDRGDPVPLARAQADVVKAFNAVVPEGDVVTQTAALKNDKYAVTVITTQYVAEYVLNKQFNVEKVNNIVGATPAEASAAAEGASALERAYAEALRLSGLSEDAMTGFDFDRDAYMGKQAYKVEIEEVGAKYKYVFDAATFALLDSEIELENDARTGSYISQDKAYELALNAAGVTTDVGATAVVRSELEDGRKVYKVSFDFASYRYDVSVDAVSGDIVRFSKSATLLNAPTVAQNITEEQAKAVAVAFVYPEGAPEQAPVFRKVKLDYENGKFVYEVELIAKGAEYEFEIAAEGGAILDVEIDNVDKMSAPLPQDKRFISREQAIAAVKEAAGKDAFVLEVEIEKEGGKYFYEIEVKLNGVKREYLVDALTGEIANNFDAAQTVILEEDALRIALEYFGVGAEAATQKSVKLERENGILCFSVKFRVADMEYEAEIDAMTGAVLKHEAERDDDIPPTMGLTVSREQAIAALRQALGEGAVIGEVELEFEGGRYYYEAEVVIGGREYDYFVDATTGAVTKRADMIDGGSVVISEEEAFQTALNAFGLNAEDVQLRRIRLERDGGRLCYDVEFFVGNLKYEAEIDAETGVVIEKDASYD